jgi:hypothetical protein
MFCQVIHELFKQIVNFFRVLRTQVTDYLTCTILLASIVLVIVRQRRTLAWP